MKKVLSVVALVAFAFTANAQLFFGGNVGLTTRSQTWVANAKSFDYTLAPKIGFEMDPFSFGAYLSYSCDKVKDKDDKDTYLDKNISWEIAPFARYQFAEIGDLSVKAELVVPFGKSKNENTTAGVETTTKSDMQFSIFVRPVLAYSVSDHFDLEFGMNFLTLGFYHYGDEDNSFNFGANSTGATLGFIYKL